MLTAVLVPAGMGYHVNANQELVALGIANVATGLFQGFLVSGSASRTPVAKQAGAKTQVAAVAGACFIMLLLLFAPSLLSTLPHAALGAVVICACLGQIEAFAFTTNGAATMSAAGKVHTMLRSLNSQSTRRASGSTYQVGGAASENAE